MSSLGDKARSAVWWNTGFNLFRSLLQFGSMLVLVRLLTPEEYGQYGLASSVIGLLIVFSFRGFLDHTLQVRRDEETHYQDHFTAGAVIQVGAFLLTNAAAVGLRWIPSYAESAGLVHLLSIVFLLDLPNSLRTKMLERDLDWKRLRLLHAVGLAAGTALSIVLAVVGAGAFALAVAGLIVTLPFIWDLFIARGWRPTWTWSSKNYVAAWRFGLSRMGSGLLQSGRRLMESGLFVLMAGFADFGIFGRSIGLAQLVCVTMPFHLMSSIYPVLTKMEPNSETSRRINGLALRTVAWVVIPVAVLLAVLSDPVVRVIYGNQWLDVIPLLPWALAAGAAGAISHAGYTLLLANQRQKRCLLADSWVFAGTGASLLLLLPSGVEAYLMGFAAVQTVGLVLVLYWLYRDRAVTWSGIDGALLRPLMAVTVVFFVCEALRGWGKVEFAGYGSALAYGAVFGVLYLGLMRLLFARLLNELVSYFPGKRLIARVLLLRT